MCILIYKLKCFNRSRCPILVGEGRHTNNKHKIIAIGTYKLRKNNVLRHTHRTFPTRICQQPALDFHLANPLCVLKFQTADMSPITASTGNDPSSLPHPFQFPKELIGSDDKPIPPNIAQFNNNFKNENPWSLFSNLNGKSVQDRCVLVDHNPSSIFCMWWSGITLS